MKLDNATCYEAMIHVDRLYFITHNHGGYVSALTMEKFIKDIDHLKPSTMTYDGFFKKVLANRCRHYRKMHAGRPMSKKLHDESGRQIDYVMALARPYLAKRALAQLAEFDASV